MDDTGAKQQRPVMADVAVHAGVSLKTVSRVINGEPYVRDAVRQRVHQSIRTLGFKPNSAARALVTRKVSTIGALLPASSLYGPASQLQGLQAAALERGFSLVVACVDVEGSHDLQGGLPQLLASGVGGLIIGSTFVDEALSFGDLTSLPPVVIYGDSKLVVPHWPIVAVDQVSGASRAVQHLLDLGHDTVHHIAGPPQWHATQRRAEAWRETLERAGRRVPDLVVGDWSARSGYELGKQLLEQDRPTAIFAANDDVALGVLRAAHDLGIGVPSGLSVVGFDDSPHTAYTIPPLTTIRQDFGLTADRAVEALVRLMDGEEVTPVPLSQTELVVRSSTAPPPTN